MAATHRRMLKIENLGENSLKWLPNRNGSSMEAWIRYKSPHMAAESRWQRWNEQTFLCAKCFIENMKMFNLMDET